MNDKYILDDQGEPVVVEDLREWGEWFETSTRKVARETIGESDVSTVFLGLDHAFAVEKPHSPILWETMVFGGKLDEEQDRCSGSREQAEAMHKRMVERVKDRTWL